MRYKKDCQNIMIKLVQFEQNFVDKSNENILEKNSDQIVGTPECQNNNSSPVAFSFHLQFRILSWKKILFSIYKKDTSTTTLVGADVENPEPHLLRIPNILWKETQVGNYVF